MLPNFEVFELFEDEDFIQLKVEKELMRACLRGVAERALPLVSTYSKRIDCECWSPSDVREHVIGFGECFAPFAEALFKDSIPGYALLRVHPESILRDYADHTCKKCRLEMMHIFYVLRQRRRRHG